MTEINNTVCFNLLFSVKKKKKMEGKKNKEKKNEKKARTAH